MLSPDGRWWWDGYHWWSVPPKPVMTCSGGWSLGLGAIPALAVPPVGVALAVAAIVIGWRARWTRQRSEAMIGFVSGAFALLAGIYLSGYVLALFLGIVH